MTSRIFTASEFAPLKTVVLAQSEMLFPKKVMSEKDAIIFPEGQAPDIAKIGGLTFEQAFPEKYQAWLKERENLRQTLEKHGVSVLRPRLLTTEEKAQAGDFGCSNFFVRDPFFTIGNFIIEGSLRFFHRRNEILPVRHVLEQAAADGNAYYLATPKPDTSQGVHSEAGPFIEGGDVLVWGKTVFVGNSGQATNHAGFVWLKKLLAHWDYDVIEVPLTENVLHLDCAMSLVREGLLIWSPEAFPNGLPEKLKDWDKIDVPAEQIAHLAINGLPINENVYIMDPAFADIGAQLQARGIAVEYIDFAISRSLGGSFRCSTQPLWREG